MSTCNRTAAAELFQTVLFPTIVVLFFLPAEVSQAQVAPGGEGQEPGQQLLDHRIFDWVFVLDPDGGEPRRARKYSDQTHLLDVKGPFWSNRREPLVVDVRWKWDNQEEWQGGQRTLKYQEPVEFWEQDLVGLDANGKLPTSRTLKFQIWVTPDPKRETLIFSKDFIFLPVPITRR